MRLRARAPQDEASARLMTIPGVGPICAAAVAAFSAPMESFPKGRDFAVWLGLTPRQHSTGGKAILGRMSKMPNGTDLSVYTESDLDQIALRLNMRPRKTLGFQTPADTFDRAVALTG